jgi:methylated-DNA-protein-cysteine methyltransferase related protein
MPDVPSSTSKPPERTAFEADVRAVLEALRPGEVVSYGEVAAQAGHPGAARAVGRRLGDSDGLPWWRVVRADGRLAPGHEVEQASRLAAEGVTVDQRRSPPRVTAARSL